MPNFTRSKPKVDAAMPVIFLNGYPGTGKTALAAALVTAYSDRAKFNVIDHNDVEMRPKHWHQSMSEPTYGEKAAYTMAEQIAPESQSDRVVVVLGESHLSA
jgi:tRNA uridine 5-carbamoylmethylation protein Kti12